MSNVALRKAADIEQYNPKEGLDHVFEAQAAIDRFARARDIEGLRKASADMLGEQRRFILWWDGQKKRAGARDGKRRVTNDTPLIQATDLGLGSAAAARSLLKRWRADVGGTEEEFAEGMVHYIERLWLMYGEHGDGKKVRGTQGKNENEWFTPREDIELAREVMIDIDLDPATHAKAQETVQAHTFFTKETNGLTKEWHGRVWLNPPYEQPLIEQFVDKLIAERTAGRVTAAILLTHNYTDTVWFHNIARAVDAICFTKGRIEFWNPDGEISSPTQGQAFSYLGNDITRFCDIFSRVGSLVIPVRR
jgi:phage N-6-adenine-methyltransferase